MGRPSDAKEKLLQVAFDLIWNQSYGSVSVDQICERANVNKGSFYHFFESKSDLAIAAYEENWRERQPELDRIFSPQVPPLERLERWCEHVYERQRKKAEKYGHVCGCPYASLGVEVATQDERIRAEAQALVERSIRYIESALRDAKADGLISIDDLQAAARRIYTMTLGMVLYAKIRNDLTFLHELKSAVMDMIGVRKAVT
jgi:TetR/AcrR family transcriptional regulator, transcriptional repressor for nem operon